MISWKTAALAATTWVSASVTCAQQVTHVVKTNPFGLFASQYQLAYEHGINDNFSVQLSTGFMGGSGIFNNDDNVGVRLGLNLGFGW